LAIELDVLIKVVFLGCPLDVGPNLRTRGIERAPIRVWLKRESINMSWNLLSELSVGKHLIRAKLAYIAGNTWILVFQPRSSNIRVLLVYGQINELVPGGFVFHFMSYHQP
jgi:hypothetical protein